jgi:hypothetical protein
MSDQCQNFSQAAAHPRRGNEHYPKWNFLQGMTHMLHNKRRKSKGEKLVDFKDLHARNDARHDYGITMIHIPKKVGRPEVGLPFKWAIK